MQSVGLQRERTNTDMTTILPYSPLWFESHVQALAAERRGLYNHKNRLSEDGFYFTTPKVVEANIYFILHPHTSPCLIFNYNFHNFRYSKYFIFHL